MYVSLCIYVCECGFVHVNAGASGGQKKVRPLELELQELHLSLDVASGN